MHRRDFVKRAALFSTTAHFAPQMVKRSRNRRNTALFQAGFAERDITPALGMEQPGGYGKAYHQSFHDACKVRAAVFDDGQTTVALVGVDAISVPRSLVLSARAAIGAQCGITGDAVLIGASHSHTSGPVSGVLPGEFDHASKLVQRLAYEESTSADPNYMEHVEHQIVSAVCQAYQSREEAQCGVGSGVEDKVAYNRRFRMKNGLTYTHPGQQNPDIIEPAGPIDPEVGVVGAWNADGQLLGCIVNYACHATTNPAGISANWIYYMEQTIQGAMGAKVPVVFLAGASGDITQVDNLSPYKRPSGEEEAQYVGSHVGAEAVKVLLSAEPETSMPLDKRSVTLRIKRRAPQRDRVKHCLELVRQTSEEIGRTKWLFAKEIVLLDALLEKEPVADVEVQAVQVGPAVFPSNPAEYFCQLGLDIKAGSSFPFTFPVTLANGIVGYVPTEEAFGEQGGGYETRLTDYSNLEITAGRQMADAALGLIEQLSPGALPQPPRAPVGTPWSYGSVPPEPGI